MQAPLVRLVEEARKNSPDRGVDFKTAPPLAWLRGEGETFIIEHESELDRVFKFFPVDIFRAIFVRDDEKGVDNARRD